MVMRMGLLNKGWTQKQLGNRCDPKISPGRISDIELGKKKPTTKECQTILKALFLKPDLG
jgi:hypothetical protein